MPDRIFAKRLLLLALLGAAAAALLLNGLQEYLSLEYLKGKQAELDRYRFLNPFTTAGTYALIYILVTALSLPGAAIMTLAGGAVFGLLWGTILASIASTIGAAIAFLVSRYLLRDAVQSRFGERLRKINAGVERDGVLYLFTLRLVPLFPFFVINLVMGLTPMRTLPYVLVTQVGMLPATLVYVNAGTQIARINAPGDILSPPVVLSLTLLGLFPLVAKKTVDSVMARRHARAGAEQDSDAEVHEAEEV